MSKRGFTSGSGHDKGRPLPVRGLLSLLPLWLFLASGASQPQELGAGTINDSARASALCSSVVLQRCALPTQEPARHGARADSRQIAQQRLEARRLQQLQAEAGLDTVEIVADRPPKLEPEPWEDFRQAVSGAAVPSCFGPSAVPHDPVEATGLLVLPFLVHAHIVGRCR